MSTSFCLESFVAWDKKTNFFSERQNPKVFQSPRSGTSTEIEFPKSEIYNESISTSQSPTSSVHVQVRKEKSQKERSSSNFSETEKRFLQKDLKMSMLVDS